MYTHVGHLSISINICAQKIELPEYTEDEYEEHLKTINDGVGVSCTPLADLLSLSLSLSLIHLHLLSISLHLHLHLFCYIHVMFTISLTSDY